jgi:hypothetical protein
MEGAVGAPDSQRLAFDIDPRGEPTGKPALDRHVWTTVSVSQAKIKIRVLLTMVLEVAQRSVDRDTSLQAG